MNEYLGRFTKLGRASCGVVLAWLFLLSNAAVGDQQEGKPHEEAAGLCPGAETQLALNDCAAKMHQEEDDELNRIYQEILKKYKADSVFIKKFRQAQQAWIKFRDAQFDAMFPQILDTRGQYNYGSVFPMCASLYKAKLTHLRVEELRLWLDGIEEGDACSGSLPIKEGDP